MTITTWLMILAFTIGSRQSIESDSTTSATTAKIASNCWINGVWYNPCPTDPLPPSDPKPSPEIALSN